MLYVASVLTLIGLESGRPLALFPYFTNELIFSKSSLFSASILSPTLLAEFCIQLNEGDGIFMAKSKAFNPLFEIEVWV